MRVLIVPDSFKESLSADEVAVALEKGIKAADPLIDVSRLPFSDAGEGGLELISSLFKGKIIEAATVDALGRACKAPYFLFADRKAAWIELSRASGLAQIEPELRNPLITSTYGTGLLIRNALDRGATEIYLGIGGSATNDAGAGILEALGGLLTDAEGELLPQGGEALAKLDHIDVEAIPRFSLKVACDVSNPLLGPNGASSVYGPQKGATPKHIEILESALQNFAKHIELLTKTNVVDLKGGGAAGGTAAALHGLLGAELIGGFELLAELAELEKHIVSADLIITAEGRIDGQSLQGKVPVGVARLAKKHHKPVWAFAGALGEDINTLYDQGISGLFSIQQGPMTLDQSMAKTAELLEKSAERIMRSHLNTGTL